MKKFVRDQRWQIGHPDGGGVGGQPHAQSPVLQLLSVQMLFRGLRIQSGVHFDESELISFSDVNIGDLTEFAEKRPQLVFGRIERQISDE